MNKKAFEAVQRFISYLMAADTIKDKIAALPKEDFVDKNGGVDQLMMRLAHHIMRPDDDEQYPTINFCDVQ